MLDKNKLIKSLASIDGQDYVNYQSLIGHYDFSWFELIIEHIPKDPFAPPHTGLYRIRGSRSDKNIIHYDLSSKVQITAFADYIARRFSQACEQVSKGLRGTGFSGLISINQPGQIIIERSNVVITDDFIEVRCFLGLPGNRRKILSDIAEDMFITELPKIAELTLLDKNIDHEALQKHIETAEDAEYLRNKLDSFGLVAFIANHSVLPRESGISDKPMLEKLTVPFITPDNLSYEIELPHKGKVKGLAIKKGVTLIVGGGFHGKSTLLNTLEAGIYNHIPDDGREYCVSNMKSVKVRAYSGRRVVNTDISAFINNLPFKSNTSSFSTENASGSTSQAVNIIESIEVGAEVLLMDEDTCATNFMIRDFKMQQLINDNDEPITPFINKVKQLYTEKGISTVLVLGGVGDYFDVSDHVIQMTNYLPLDVTEKAHQISSASSTIHQNSKQNVPISLPISIKERIPVAKSINPINEYGKFSIFAKDSHNLNFGSHVVDLTDVEQLIELSQTKALGFAIEYAKKHMSNETTLRDVIERVEEDIELNGLDVISDTLSGYFAKFRAFELAFAINRLRDIELIQKSD